jgi:hypothetical protein
LDHLHISSNWITLVHSLLIIFKRFLYVTLLDYLNMPIVKNRMQHSFNVIWQFGHSNVNNVENKKSVEIVESQMRLIAKHSNPN